ncbi:hypothetical protein [Saccharicrinis sp. FJH54]|uniref:hypothetical protein n=1 Tax=Saccharicrinis sp. FJH54 TaxID=3344665 RepID=UPI0035D3EB0C
MLPEYNIPRPFRYNPLKHHRINILEFIKTASNETMKIWAELVQSNYIDIYTGILNPELICEEIMSLISEKGILTKKQFLHWVQTPHPYKIMTLSDRSEWILRKGDDQERYIHIHPSRTGMYTLRFKGTTLLTAYKLHQKYKSAAFIPTLYQVNEARKEMNFSPVKRISPDKGILKCWQILFIKST